MNVQKGWWKLPLIGAVSVLPMLLFSNSWVVGLSVTAIFITGLVYFKAFKKP